MPADTEQRTATIPPEGPLIPEEEGDLLPDELYWRDHYDWLVEQGYILRERYRPGWAPKPGSGFFDGPNNPSNKNGYVFDAVRKLDGKRVVLKRISTSTHPDEVEIGRFFATEPLASHPKNHCVPLLQVLSIPDDPDNVLLVMPFLRTFDDPPFNTVGEVVDALKQVLEGLHFMHQCHVAHRDCGGRNIMFDPEPLYPKSYHPVLTRYDANLRFRASHYSRTFRPTKYYLIDFGLSTKYAEDETSPREEPIIGGDKSVPEFRYDDLHDPFPTDVYYVGNVMRENILQKFKGVEFLSPLVADMVQDDPQARPNMDEVMSRFDQLTKRLSWWKLRSRVRPVKESFVGRAFRTVGHFFKAATYVITLHSAVPKA